jgi:hypothetical protein
VTTIGVVGAQWRATVTEAGTICPWDGSEPLDWHIAADDRWHSPSREDSARQTLAAGVPVVETRVRVPRGDVVHCVYSVADDGGLTVITITNESPLPVAIALTRPDLLSSRPPTTAPIEGIAVPACSVLFPLGHQSQLTVALAHDGRGVGPLPSTAGADQVRGGWLTQLSRAGRLEVPSAHWVEAINRRRSTLLLEGPTDGAPIEFVHDVTELSRLGDDIDPWLDQLAERVPLVARGDHPLTDSVLWAVRRLFRHANERRAVRDVDALLRRRSPADREVDGDPVGSLVAVDAESRLVDTRSTTAAEVLPFGIPGPWLGLNFEVHNLPCGDGALSYAVRWHGERPALLWQYAGPPVTLSGPGGWHDDRPSGEALWPAPELPQPNPQEPISFS